MTALQVTNASSLILRVVVWSCLLVACALGADTTSAQDYSFDTAALEKKPLEHAADIEIWPALVVYNRKSPLYALKYRSAEISYADIYNAKADGSVRYQFKSLLASASGSLFASYPRVDDTLAYDWKLYEIYLKYSPNASFSFLAGKQTFRWGKGYAYNPVAFAGRPKDLNDIDAVLEGYWNLSAEYVRSFNAPLSTFAITGVLLPVLGIVNKSYLPDTSLAGVIQTYFLFFDTDIDFYLFVDDRKNFKGGFDFSKNILPDWEMHGELTYAPNAPTTFFINDTTLETQNHSVTNLVLGTRYLAPFNTTFILEYLHNGAMHSAADMKKYYSAMTYALASGSPTVHQDFLQCSMQYYGNQFNMTDYIYVKATHPDPFNFVYFTPSIYGIVNLKDGSLMGGIELSYTRLKHVAFTARYIGLAGNVWSEYGIKQAQQKIELRSRIAF